MRVAIGIACIVIGVLLVLWAIRGLRARPADTTAATTLTVASSADALRFSEGNTIRVGDEYYVITKIDGPTLTVRRP